LIPEDKEPSRPNRPELPGIFKMNGLITFPSDLPANALPILPGVNAIAKAKAELALEEFQNGTL
jgi:hypothetical protein